MDLYSQYLMWMKSKHIFNAQYFQASSISTSFNNSSWEEQAFAEDAGGPLGGFIWPPRSYFCSFCKREFRSAQALGGHMNVHRKDRARLKQSLSDHHQNHSKTLGAQYPSQVCTSDSNPNFVAPHLSSSPSRVNSATSTLENVIEHTFFSSCPSSFAEESYKNSTYSPPWPPLPSTGSDGDEGVNRKRHKAAVSALEDLDLELRLGDPPNYIR